MDRPSAREFGRFARAMGRRYNGAFHPLGGPVAIPRVDVFELWNEANVPTFMQPQWRGGVPVAADQYRALVQAAYPAIKAVNRSAKVLIGVTAPGGFAHGGATSPIAPIPFLRRLACVDARLRRVHDGGCRHFRRVPGDGFSHHPYALKSPPGVPTSDRNIVRMANLDRLTSLTTRLVARHRLAPGTRDLWLTESGYETNDPVRTKPWTLDQQSRLLAQAEYLAQRNVHVRAFTQFLLRDVQTAAALRLARRGSKQRAPGSWQTGLYYEDFRPKPSAFTFPVTLLPVRSGAGTINLFGHIRTDKTGGLEVHIQGLQSDNTWQSANGSRESGVHHRSRRRVPADPALRQPTPDLPLLLPAPGRTRDVQPAAARPAAGQGAAEVAASSGIASNICSMRPKETERRRARKLRAAGWSLRRISMSSTSPSARRASGSATFDPR